MSAIGPKRTSPVAPHMSAFGGKADIAPASQNVRWTSWWAEVYPPAFWSRDLMRERRRSKVNAAVQLHPLRDAFGL